MDRALRTCAPCQLAAYCTEILQANSKLKGYQPHHLDRAARFLDPLQHHEYTSQADQEADLEAMRRGEQPWTHRWDKAEPEAHLDRLFSDLQVNAPLNNMHPIKEFPVELHKPVSNMEDYWQAGFVLPDCDASSLHTGATAFIPTGRLSAESRADLTNSQRRPTTPRKGLACRLW